MNPRRAVGLVQPLIPGASAGTVVLAYHLIGAGTASPVDVSRDGFQRQLDHLSSKFDVVSLAAALDDPPSDRPRAVLTFDDGFRNFHEVAWPILRERNLPSVLYVPVGFINNESPSPLSGASLPPCSWPELRELSQAGVEIGSHSMGHVDLRKITAERLERELGESRRILERELGISVTSFCYPQAKHDPRTVRAARRHYANALVAGGRRYRGGDPHRIPRFPVRRDETDFEAMVSSSLWLTEMLADRARHWLR